MTNIPTGFQTRYFTETESNVAPVIERDGANLIIPVFIREDGETFRYYRVPAKYIGQNLADYEQTVIKSYADIRRFFYGSASAQGEMRDDHVWEAHRQAVRSAFPKHADEPNHAEERFNAIKADFWATIDSACTAVGKTREDLPSYFTAEAMLDFAADNGMSASNISKFAQKFITLSLDLVHNDRNWSELFK